MTELLKGIPVRAQRQDSVIDQLHDLVRVATRLGMYDAADALQQAFELGKFENLKYGCHVELTEGFGPDDCVISSGAYHMCAYAKIGMRPEQCDYWRPIASNCQK